MARKMNVFEKRKSFVENIKNLNKSIKHFSDRKYVIGIDPSLTNTGIAVGSIEDDNFYKLFSTSSIVKQSKRLYKQSVYERLYIINSFIKKIFETYPSILVVMEGYAYSSMQNRELLGEVSGSIKKIFWNNSEIVSMTLLPTPNQLKKYIIGKSEYKITKDKILMAVYKNMNIEAGNNDEADALVLMKIGIDLIKTAIRINKMIPKSDKELRLFIKNGEKTTKLKQYEWETIVSLLQTRCGNTLFDYFDIEKAKWPNFLDVNNR